MPVLFSHHKLLFCLVAILCASGSGADEPGFALQVFGVHVQRGQELSIRAKHLEISAKGRISAEQADFSFNQTNNPITGSATHLSARDSAGPWDFKNMQTYSKDMQVQFGSGQYDATRSTISGATVAIANQTFDVTAPSGSFNLRNQSARLLGGVSGNIRP